MSLQKISQDISIGLSKYVTTSLLPFILKMIRTNNWRCIFVDVDRRPSFMLRVKSARGLRFILSVYGAMRPSVMLFVGGDVQCHAVCNWVVWPSVMLFVSELVWPSVMLSVSGTVWFGVLLSVSGLVWPSVIFSVSGAVWLRVMLSVSGLVWPRVLLSVSGLVWPSVMLSVSGDVDLMLWSL